MKRITSSALLIAYITMYLVSCNIKHDNSEEVKSVLQGMLGKHILLDDEMEYLQPESSDGPINQAKVFEAKFKIVSIVNGNCNACIDELEQWEDEIDFSDINQLSYVFVITSFDRFQNFKFMLETAADFKYPVFLDTSGTFKSANNIPNDHRYQTFLLDRNNEILAVGHPVKSKEVNHLYKKLIQSSLK